MNFNNITTLATGLAAWAAEVAGEEETPTYLIGTLALGALAAFGAYLYAYNQRAGHVAPNSINNAHFAAQPDLHIAQEAPSIYGDNQRSSQVAPDLDTLVLNFEYEDLEVSPDLSNTPHLETLRLGDNRLSIPPDLSHTPELKELNLSRNRLAVAPDLSLAPHLEILGLNVNQLGSAPDVSMLLQLSMLFLQHNQLAIAPDVSHNPQLSYLYLNNNQLAIAPDVSHNSELTEFYLNNNQLAIAPDVSHNPKLTSFNLSDNRLTELHDSILSLSRGCVVYAESNRFSAEYVAEFQERLRQHRLAHPDQGPTVHMSIYDEAAAVAQPHGAAPVSLEEELAIWAQEFEIAFPEESNPELWAHQQQAGSDLQEHFAQLQFLSVDEKVMLANYLRRLRNVQDYKNGGENRRGIVLRVERMLQLANQNPVFRQEVLQLIQQGSVSCGDRVQLYFDEIEIAWHFSHRELTPEEFRQLAIRAERCRQLQLHAERQAALHQLGDEVETVLYYRVHLRDALNLPVSTRNMLYPGVSGVTPEMLNAARAEIEAFSDDQLLATSSHWQARMAQLHQNKVNEITNQYTGFVNDLEEYLKLESTGEQEQYLESRDDLAELIGRALSLDIVGYPAISGFIDLERQRVISELI